MRTRTTLNIAFFNGSMLLAAVFGGLTQSWPVFGIALVALFIGNLLTREIRPGRQPEHRKHIR